MCAQAKNYAPADPYSRPKFWVGTQIPLRQPFLGLTPCPPQEEEDGENDMRVPFASLYWNEFGVLNLGLTTGVDVEKLHQQK